MEISPIFLLNNKFTLGAPYAAASWIQYVWLICDKTKFTPAQWLEKSWNYWTISLVTQCPVDRIIAIWHHKVNTLINLADYRNGSILAHLGSSNTLFVEICCFLVRALHLPQKASCSTERIIFSSKSLSSCSNSLLFLFSVFRVLFTAQIKLQSVVLDSLLSFCSRPSSSSSAKLSDHLAATLVHSTIMNNLTY